MRHSGILPVVVIGNGPVGQSAALLLARWKVPVVLLDERPAREPVGSKAICQQRDVLDIWTAVGAGAIVTEGLTWRTVRTFYKDRQLFSYDLFDGSKSALPPFVNLSQMRTEQILDEQIARRQPLIDDRWDHRVTHIEQSAGVVEVACETRDGAVHIEGSYALVCAGARSEPLRRDLGVSFDGVSFDDRFLICDIETDLPGWANERRFYFDPQWNPGRQVLIHPCPDGVFRIDWQVPSDFNLEAERASGALDARVRAIIGDRPYRIVWTSLYRFHSRVVNRMCVGRALLAGDCAHVVAPFGARGLNSGVQDVENAAWKLAFVLHGWAGPELLESYHLERRAAALENIEVTTRTMELLAPQTEELRQKRTELLERALVDPSAWPSVDSGRFAEPFWYVDSPLTTPDVSRPFGGRPPRGKVPSSGPGILIPDAPISEGSAKRLREICRDGLLLLAGRAVDTTSLREVIGETIPAGLPVRVIAMVDALGGKPGEVWIVRPDAHIAAIVDGNDGHAVVQAIRRARAVHAFT